MGLDGRGDRGEERPLLAAQAVGDEVMGDAVEPGEDGPSPVAVAVDGLEGLEEDLGGNVFRLLAPAKAGVGVAVEQGVVLVVPGGPDGGLPRLRPADEIGFRVERPGGGQVKRGDRQMSLLVGASGAGVHH